MPQARPCLLGAVVLLCLLPCLACFTQLWPSIFCLPPPLFCFLCSSLYTRKYAITVIASSFGPWLSLAMFAHLGNRWHADDCRLVLLSGVALMALPLALMCLFDDDRALQHPPHREQQQQQQQQHRDLLPTSDSGAAAAVEVEAGLEERLLEDDGGNGGGAQQAGCCSALPPGLVVTLLITGSDLIGALASGKQLLVLWHVLCAAFEVVAALLSHYCLT
jgi:hypothetical protein